MPKLDWIGRKAVVAHHNDVPFRLITPDEKCSTSTDSDNLIVQGDNLHALKALLPRYARQVKCIYIDPPYNTGKEKWIYNDNVNSPEIQRWLTKVVGGEGEDLSRHDKWLCMMYPRLTMLKDFLRDDGVIFVSIDDNELASLRCLMDEIFGRRNFVGTIIWRNVTDNNPTNISTEHEYIVCYCRDIRFLESVWSSSNFPVKDRLIQLGEEFISQYHDSLERQSQYTKWFRENKAYMWPFDRYKHIDDGGIYTGSQSVHNPGKEGYRYDVIHPVTGKPCREPLMGYRFPETTMQDLLDRDRVLFGKDENKIIELKLYLHEYRTKMQSLIEMDTRLGANELRRIFPEKKRTFDFPKPSSLIAELLAFVVGPDDIVLDSFAGSGSTGHAVAFLNSLDNGNRKFILVELENEIAVNVTCARIKRVLGGYKDGKGRAIKGLGGDFYYGVLDEKPVVGADGGLDAGIPFGALAEYIWYLETNTGYQLDFTSPLIGTYNGTAIYVLAECFPGDKPWGDDPILTRTVLKKLPKHDGPKVIYAAATRLSRAQMLSEEIIFKQIPYGLMD